MWPATCRSRATASAATRATSSPRKCSRQADAARNMAVHIVTPAASVRHDSRSRRPEHEPARHRRRGHEDRPRRQRRSLGRSLGGLALLDQQGRAELPNRSRASTADGARRSKAPPTSIRRSRPSRCRRLGRVEVVPGKPGTGHRSEPTRRRARRCGTERSRRSPIEVHVEQGALAAPVSPTRDAQQVAEQANTLAHHSLTVTLGAADQAARSRNRRVVASSRPERGRAHGRHRRRRGDRRHRRQVRRGRPAAPVDASFTVEAGKPVLHPSQDGTGCCEPGAAQKVLAALQSNAPTLTLSVVTQRPNLTTEAAQQLGVVAGGRPARHVRTHDAPRVLRVTRHEHPPDRRHRARSCDPSR